MLLRDAFKTSTRSLAHGKMRSILTMLGIVIGIASVIILMSIGQSAQNLILGQVESVGSNLIIIMPGAPSGGGFSAPASAQGIVITSLKQEDVDALQREPSIDLAVPEVRGQAEIIYGNNNATESYTGSTADFFIVSNLAKVSEGQTFSKSDVDSANHVVVIGPDLAKTLFGPNIDPLNKNIMVKNVSFRVIGVLNKGGTGAFGVDIGNLVVIPITVAQKELLGTTYFNVIIVQANAAYDINFVKSRISFILQQNHGITDPTKDDFSIETQADILSILGSITSVLTLFLAAIASISLIVGGIGIMNIMLSHRTNARNRLAQSSRRDRARYFGAISHRVGIAHDGRRHHRHRARRYRGKRDLFRAVHFFLNRLGVRVSAFGGSARAARFNFIGFGFWHLSRAPSGAQKSD
jgi:putative ABC transport system permease protein